MNEMSLAEVVEQLDSSDDPRTCEAEPQSMEGSSETALRDGLRSTDRLLDEMRGRYRELQEQRSRLVERLRRLEAQRARARQVQEPEAIAV